MEKKHIVSKIIAVLSLMLAAAILFGSMYIDLRAAVNLGRQVAEVDAMESVANKEVQFSYKGLIFRLNFGCEGDSDEAGSRAFFKESIAAECCRTFFAEISEIALLSLLAVFVASYAIKSGHFPGRKKPVGRFALTLTAIAVFALFLGVYAATWFGSGLKASGATASKLIAALASFLAVPAAAGLVELAYNKLRLKFPVWVLVLGLAVLGYFVGALAKLRLWLPKEEASFGYVAEQDPRLGDPEYDDLVVWNEDGTLTFDGKTYEPEMLPVKDRATGAAWGLWLAAEIVHPGTGLYIELMLESGLEDYALIAAGYAAVAALWILVCALLNRKKKES